MAFRRARGLRFHTQQMGKAAAGAPVVMLHGLFTGSLASWWFTAAPVVARTHPVRLLDLRGHGLSDCPPTGYDAATMAADVLALTDDLPPFAVVGHSFGALLGLRLALDHPERVTALACVEAPLVAIRDRGPDDERDAPSDEATETERRLLTETTILADLRGEAPVTDDDLRAVGVPLLFAFGDRSWCAPAAERVATVRPDAEVAVLAGGHALHLDARDDLAALLVDFLDRVPAAAADEPEAPAGTDERPPDAAAPADDHEPVPHG